MSDQTERPTPTREECIRAAAQILARAALRIHRERLARDNHQHAA